MSTAESLVPEYDHEWATTRRLLERVPEADFGWKPHEKSMTLGALCGHLANLPAWCSAVLEKTVLDLDVATDDIRARDPSSRTALIEELDRKVAAARARLVTMLDAEFLVPWTLKKGDQLVFTLPRISAIRAFVMNHSIHHRGQLTVYLRLRGVSVPPIYGPTADEQ